MNDSLAAPPIVSAIFKITVATIPGSVATVIFADGSDKAAADVRDNSARG